MMERTARVVAIHADHMEVAVHAAAACGACGARKACQGDAAARVFALPIVPGVEAGSDVSLALEDHRLILSAVLAYLLPATACVFGAVIGQALGHANLAAFAGAVLGLCAGLLPARLMGTWVGHHWNEPAIHGCSSLPSPEEKRSSAT